MKLPPQREIARHPLANSPLDVFIAPGVYVLGNVRIGSNAVLMFGAVLRAEFDRIEIGRYTNVQDNAVVHADIGHPCLIGERVTVGHSAVVHGARIGNHCLVGLGARVLNDAELGEGAWLGAGAVLSGGRSIPPWTLGVGMPARPIRDLSAQEIARQRRSIDDYQRIAPGYLAWYSRKERGDGPLVPGAGRDPKDATQGGDLPQDQQ